MSTTSTRPAPGPITGLDRLRRVTDLFVHGTTLVLGADDDGPILVWVQKPNAFERSESLKDGAFGRARRLLDTGPDSEEAVVAATAMLGKSDVDLVEEIIGPDRYRHILAARDDVRADPDWADDLLVMDRGEELLADAAAAGRELRPDQAERLMQLQRAFLDAQAAALEARLEAARAEITERCPTREDLEQAYLQAWREMSALDAFSEESSITEIYFALRDCQARASATSGEWDHTGCAHPRLLSSRAQVRELSADFLTPVRDALSGLQMSQAAAGNSDAPSTSSGSSEQHAAQEDSTASTPAATSSAPAGTSSRP